MKNAEISRRIIAAIAAGQTTREAFDAVLGAGSFEKLAGEIYDEMKARALGAAAFAAGIKRAPALDNDLLPMLAGNEIGAGLPVLSAWLAGWDAANLAPGGREFRADGAGKRAQAAAAAAGYDADGQQFAYGEAFDADLFAAWTPATARARVGGTFGT
jgi:hypothetical protein